MKYLINPNYFVIRFHWRKTILLEKFVIIDPPSVVAGRTESARRWRAH